MAKTKGLTFTKEDLEYLYHTLGKTVKEIAEIYSVAEPSMSYHFKKHRIVKRSPRERKLGPRNPMYGVKIIGRKHSEETKEKIKNTRKRGKDHFRYKNPKDRIEPINTQIRNCAKSKEWKFLVLKRDNFKCILCNSKEKLQVDHIVPFAIIKIQNKISSLEEALLCSSLWDISNGRTLCKECHMKTDTWGSKTKVII